MANEALDLEQTEIIIVRNNTICRLCASQNEKLIGIYSEEGLSNGLSNLINLYLPIKVDPTDELPLQCCWNCASTLLAWHDLVTKCVTIDKKFRSLEIVTEKGPVDEVFDNPANTLSDDNDACDNEGLYRQVGDIAAIFEAIKLKERLEQNEKEEPPEEEEEEAEPEEKADKNEILTEASKRCEICEKILSCRPNYISHIKTHLSDYFCKICCNSYNTKFKLDTHFNYHNIPKEHAIQNYVRCDFKNCSAIFPSKLQLYKHRNKHLKLERYKCDICNIEFMKANAFLNHKMKHEQPLSCKVCNKTFANKKTLREHERLHTGEKPFKCQVCNKKFRCQSGLKYHEVSHSMERKYKCQLCPLSFTRSNYLKEHLRKHSKERPFECKICKQKFIQMGVLSRHEKRVHARCDVCDKMIGKAKDLVDHKWKCHSSTTDKALQVELT